MTATAPLTWREWALALVLSACMVAGTCAAFSAGSPWALRQVEWLELLDAGTPSDVSRAAVQVLAGVADQADIVVLGDSAIREALQPDATLTAALVRRGLQRSTVVTLTSSAQLPPDALYLVRMMKVRAGQLFILPLGFSAWRIGDLFGVMAAGSYLGLPGLTPGEPSVLRQPLQDRLEWWRLAWHRVRDTLRWRTVDPLQRWVRRALYGMPGESPTGYHFNLDADSKGAGFIDQQRRVAQQEINRNFERNLALMEAALDELVQLIQRQGGRIVLATTPNADEALALANPGPARKFQQIVDRLRSRYQLVHISLDAGIAWSADDRGDLTHLGPRGRAKWSRALVDWLAADHASRSASRPPP